MKTSILSAAALLASGAAALVPAQALTERSADSTAEDIVLINWFSEGGCGSDNVSQTFATVPDNVCHRFGPFSAQSAHLVNCPGQLCLCIVFEGTSCDGTGVGLEAVSSGSLNCAAVGGDQFQSVLCDVSVP